LCESSLRVQQASLVQLYRPRTLVTAWQVVVVNETSMVPLTMMARLLEVVQPDARLILVGDPDRLASVEAGAVLHTLCAADPAVFIRFGPYSSILVYYRAANIRRHRPVCFGTIRLGGRHCSEIMALITSFRYRGDRPVSFRTQAECGWTYNRSGQGEQILQLETYASDGTTSQVLQIDEPRAKELLAILEKVFPDLRTAN
jgi:hypothetical protein